ncbi:MAG: tetratricopeptide repeat protein [Flavobacteriaceae bacterium]|nr:tetratricopeptide repeat protein [Flavobacteriaceae bacterium]
MKKIVLIAFLILSNTLFGQTVDSLFTSANKLYQQEKYSEALTAYQQIEDNQLYSDDLYYNMANAYYKMNQVAPAIYYYEKTLLLNPNHTDARHNLSFAKQMAIDNIEALPKTIGERFSEGFIQKFNYNTWAWFAVAFALLFAALFLLYHFSYSSVRKRLYFITSIVSALLVLVFVAFAYSNYEYVRANKYAIVFSQQVAVKGAPTNSGEVNFELHEGAKVKLLESLDNWQKIKIADGKIGWMPKEELREIK